MTRSLALLDSAIVDVNSLDRMLQAIVFFSDQVMIRSSYSARPQSGYLASDIEAKIRALHEAGLVKFWAHEYEINSLGKTESRTTDGHKISRSIDCVVVRSEFVEGVSKADEFMRSAREEAYRSQGPLGGFRQGTAEIVGFRNQLNSLVLASELSQDGLLSNPASRVGLVDQVRSAGSERFDGAVVSEVVRKLSLGSLAALSVDQAIEARKYSQDFRKILEASLIEAARGMDPTITPEKTAELIVERFNEVINEYLPKGARKEALSEASWDLAGLLVPSSIFAKYGFLAFKWRKQERDLRPFVLLTHLRRSLSHHLIGKTK